MGYLDDSSSDDDSDYDSEVESRPKIATKKKTTTTAKMARSFLDDSDSDDSDDDDSEGDIDFDDSFLGDFRRKQKQQKGKDLLGKQPMMDSTEKTHYAEDLSGNIEYEHDEESSEDEESEEDESSEEDGEEHVFRETTTDWMETMQRLRQHTSRKKRGALEVRFVDVIVTDRLEYCQHDDAALSVNDATHVAQNHDEIPWYEQDYQELPWWEQPDLEEDDALTALCKRILAAGEEGEENRRHIERVEANVLGFALKLKSRAKISS